MQPPAKKAFQPKQRQWQRRPQQSAFDGALQRGPASVAEQYTNLSEGTLLDPPIALGGGAPPANYDDANAYSDPGAYMDKRRAFQQAAGNDQPSAKRVRTEE